MAGGFSGVQRRQFCFRSFCGECLGRVLSRHVLSSRDLLRQQGRPTPAMVGVFLRRRGKEPQPVVDLSVNRIVRRDGLHRPNNGRDPVDGVRAGRPAVQFVRALSAAFTPCLRATRTPPPAAAQILISGRLVIRARFHGRAGTGYRTQRAARTCNYLRGNRRFNRGSCRSRLRCLCTARVYVRVAARSPRDAGTTRHRHVRLPFSCAGAFGHCPIVVDERGKQDVWHVCWSHKKE